MTYGEGWNKDQWWQLIDNSDYEPMRIKPLTRRREQQLVLASELMWAWAWLTTPIAQMRLERARMRRLGEALIAESRKRIE